MDHSALQAYAQQARRDFIHAVTGRAAFYGLNAQSIAHATRRGDTTVIGTRAFPYATAAIRSGLAQQIQREGFAQVMEEMAYTWFNRFVAPAVHGVARLPGPRLPRPQP